MKEGKNGLTAEQAEEPDGTVGAQFVDGTVGAICAKPGSINHNSNQVVDNHFFDGQQYGIQCPPVIASSKYTRG